MGRYGAEPRSTREFNSACTASQGWGAAAIEFGLLAALIAVACIVAFEAMGTSLSGMFKGVKTKLDAKQPV